MASKNEKKAATEAAKKAPAKTVAPATEERMVAGRKVLAFNPEAIETDEEIPSVTRIMGDSRTNKILEWIGAQSTPAAGRGFPVLDFAKEGKPRSAHAAARGLRLAIAARKITFADKGPVHLFVRGGKVIVAAPPAEAK